MAQHELWIGVVGLKPIDPKAWEGAVGAYTNIVTWASSREEFRKKSEELAASMKLYIFEIEDEEPVSDRTKKFSLSEELEELVDRAETNPKAILYGTFHRYPFEDA